MKKWLLAIMMLIIVTCGALVFTACLGGQNGDGDPNGGGLPNESDNPDEHVHIAASYEIIKDPTCAQTGERKGVCVECGQTFTEPVPATGHTWQLQSNVEATCTEDGKEAYQCSKCFLVKEYTTDEAIGHDWKLQSTEEATCTLDGKQIYACTRCSEIDERYTVGSALGHDWTAYTLDDNNDNPYAHTHKRYCKRQGCGVEENGVAATSDMVLATRTAETCLTDAFTDYTCSIETCSYNHTVEHANTALGHDWGKWVYSGNHVDINTHTHNCLRSNCEEAETNSCNIITTSQEPTCTRVGFTATTCEECGNEDREEIKMLEHTWGKWSIVVQSTTTTLHTRQCSVCSYRYYGSHTYETSYVEADCEHNKKTVNTCSACGNVTSTDIPNTALGHDWQVQSSNSTTHSLVCNNNNEHKLTEAHDFSTTNICHYDEVDGLTYELSADGTYFIVKNDDKVSHATEIIVASSLPNPNVQGVARTSGTLPVQIIGNSAFSNNTYITKVTLPQTLTTIEASAFSGCTNLSNIVIPETVTKIGYKALSNTAFYNNSDNWENGVLYAGLSLIKVNNAHFATTDTGFSVRENTVSISAYAFENCTDMYEVSIPATVTEIDSSAFRGCSNLATVTYGSNISDWLNIKFGDLMSSPMYYASNLNLQSEVSAVIVLPENLTSIPAGTFKGKTEITQVTIPASVISIGDEAFKGCTALTQIVFSDDHVTYMGSDAFLNTGFFATQENWQDGILILNGHHILATNENFNQTTYTIADGIRTISARAFANRNVTNLTIGKDVVWFGVGAFNTAVLENVTFVDHNSTWFVKNSGGASYVVHVTENAASNATLLKNNTGEWKKS